MKRFLAVLTLVALPLSVSAQSTSVMGKGANGAPAPIGASGDRLKVEASVPATGFPVVTSASSGSAHGETLCLASAATPIPAAALVGRLSILLQNLGPNAVFVCTSSTCTSGVGIRIAAGAAISLDFRDTIPLWCRADAADQVAGAGTRRVEVK